MSSLLSDDELVAAFQRGDAQSFNELVYRYKNSLYQYIMALVRDEGAAGDIFQEVFLNFYRRVGQYQAQGKLKNYLFTAARNRVLNVFRDRAKLTSLDEPDEDGSAHWHEELPGTDLQPLEGLERAELAQRIRHASLRLPAAQREVIYLKQYMTFKEVAELVGRPLGTVLSDHARALQKMKKFLSEEAYV